MSQFDLGTIDPNTKDGATLATDLNSWRNALHSTHRGTTAPDYAVAGTLWVDDSADPTWLLKIYDGTAWITLRTIDTFNNDALLSISEGGTGANTVEDARSNLGITNVGKNLIINGDFSSWQEGTSFTSIANGTEFADLYAHAKVGTGVYDISRDTDVPTVAESGHLSNYSLKIDVTTADTSIAASDVYYFEHRIEGYNFQRIAQQEFTLSFWHKHTKTGTYSVAFTNSGRDRTFVGEYTQSTADTWEKATITVDASPSAGTWDYTNGVGLRVKFAIATGSDFQGTVGSWNSADDRGSINQVNACDTIGNKFRIAQVKLEAGNTATDFESSLIQQELDLIHRYFWRITESGGLNFQLATGVFHTTTTGKVALIFPKTMRGAPTINFSTASDFIVQASLSRTLSAISADNLTANSARLSMTVGTAVLDGDGAVLYLAANLGGHIQADARL